MFWKLGNVPDFNIAVYDDELKKAFSYGELKQSINIFEETFRSDQKQLAFVFCDNSFRSIQFYLLLLKLEHAVFLGDSGRDLTLASKIIEVYQPDIIWHPSREIEFPNFRRLSLEKDNQVFLSLNIQKHIPIHPELAVLLSTSGTTGSSKLVRLSYKNIQSNAESIATYLNITEKEKAITTLPLHYSYGLSILHSHLYAGACLVCTNASLVHKEFWNLFKEQTCTSIAGVPYTYQMLRRLRFESMELPSLRTITQAGGGLASEQIRFFEEVAKRKKIRFFVMYGQTEASPRISYVPWEKLSEKLGSIGIPIPNGQMALYDKNEEILEVNTEGELVYKGDNVMLGYAEKREDLSKGDELKGELYTGDLAYRDEDGYFFISGRLKRMIKIFGFRLNLDEVEKILEDEFLKPFACLGEDELLQIYVESSDSCDAENAKNRVVELYKIMSSKIQSKCIEALPLFATGKKNYQALNQKV